MGVEFATTFALIFKEGPYDSHEASERGYRYDPGVVHRDESELAPLPPDGAGWAMCGATATKARLYWFWSRKRPARLEKGEAGR